MILCAPGFQLSPKFFLLSISVICLRYHVESAVHNFTEEEEFFKQLKPAFGRTDGWKVAPPTCSYPSDVLNLLAGENRANLKTQVLRESLGFLRGDENSWKQRRNTHYWQLSRQSHSYDVRGRAYFQRNWEPSISCEQEARIGIMGDGGKWVCNPANIPKGNCILYSFGSNLEFSFEVGIHEQLGCEIHTFDPTVAKEKVDAVKPEYVNYHYYGLGRDSSNVPQVGQVHNITTVLQMLGHTDRVIDILKIDIEGGEWTSMTPALFECAWPRNIRQILLEMHFRNPRTAESLYMGLQHAGYTQFHKEPNIQFSDGSCIEVGFVLLDLPKPAWWQNITTTLKQTNSQTRPRIRGNNGPMERQGPSMRPKVVQRKHLPLAAKLEERRQKRQSWKSVKLSSKLCRKSSHVEFISTTDGYTERRRVGKLSSLCGGTEEIKK